MEASFWGREPVSRRSSRPRKAASSSSRPPRSPWAASGVMGNDTVVSPLCSTISAPGARACTRPHATPRCAPVRAPAPSPRPPRAPAAAAAAIPAPPRPAPPCPAPTLSVPEPDPLFSREKKRSSLAEGGGRGRGGGCESGLRARKSRRRGPAGVSDAARARSCLPVSGLWPGRGWGLEGEALRKKKDFFFQRYEILLQ